jgi:Cu+-exporting ATPase
MTESVEDPVCGMQISAEDAVATSEYEGETYYFCAPGCKRRFDENPEQYVADEAD